MDELEISGKRYISSRRAAKENKYHTDYIGQLIRAGKIIGTKVGRAWYVDAESLALYLGTEPERTANVASQSEEEVRIPVVVQEIEHEEPVELPEEKTIQIIESTEPSAPAVSSSHAYPTLRYISEDQPLFRPSLSRDREPRTVPVYLEAAPPVLARSVEMPAHSKHTKASVGRRVVRVGLFALFAAVVFGLCFASSFLLHYDLSVQGSSTQAGVGFSLGSLHK